MILVACGYQWQEHESSSIVRSLKGASLGCRSFLRTGLYHVVGLFAKAKAIWLQAGINVYFFITRYPHTCSPSLILNIYTPEGKDEKSIVAIFPP